MSSSKERQICNKLPLILISLSYFTYQLIQMAALVLHAHSHYLQVFVIFYKVHPFYSITTAAWIQPWPVQHRQGIDY